MAFGVGGPAGAQSRPRCAAAVDGKRVDGHGSWRDPIQANQRSTLRIVAVSTAREPVSRVRLLIATGAVVVWEHGGPPPGDWVATVPIADLARLGGGLHEFEVDVDGCAIRFWVRVGGTPALRRPLGMTGAGLLGAGVVVLATTLLAARRGRRRWPIAVVAGGLGGIGALLVSHQAGQVPLTPSWLLSWLLLPAAAAGAIHAVAAATGSGAATSSAAPPRPTRGRGSGSPAAPPVPAAASDVAPPAPAPPAGAGEPRAAPPPTVPTTAPPPPVTAEPPRTSYARLVCPDVVVAGQRFPLTVGLAPSSVPGVVGAPLVLPPTTTGDYDLSVQLVADGFELPAPRHVLRVTGAEPYPSLEVEVTAMPTGRDVAALAIQAFFSVDGQTIGFAVRPVAVVAEAAMVEGTTVEASEPSTIGPPVLDEAPDLTIQIVRGAEPAGGRLLWTFESPLVPVPSEALVTDIGDDPSRFARKLIAGVAASDGGSAISPYLRGIGLTVADQMPTDVGRLLREAAVLAGARPLTVLLLSEEPYVPWELAVLDQPVRPGDPPFLGAQVELGRWTLGQRRPGLPPPRSVEVGAMAVVGGVYEGTAARLFEAEAEASELASRYGAAVVRAGSEEILGCLSGRPRADIVHFAVHGTYDATSVEEGLVLVDGTTLDPMHVKGAVVEGSPFVFLNACQVGSSNELLGDYAGVAHAFLYAGAAGVVAPLWSIADDVAREVATSFYARTLEDGERPAAALREARAMFARATGTVSATYLAYQLFGHPALRLTTAPTR